MPSQNTHALPHQTLDLSPYPLAEATGCLIEETPLHQRWICPGCGTPYTVTLPEECQSCGATGLEFEYASHGTGEPRH